MSEPLYEWNGDDWTLQRYVDEGVMSLVPDDTLQQLTDVWEATVGSGYIKDNIRHLAPELAALLDGLVNEVAPDQDPNHPNYMSDVDTTGLVSEAKTVDLTRYQKRCEGMPHRNMQDEDCIGSCFEPDDTLQQIKDAPRCEHGMIDAHDYRGPFLWRFGNLAMRCEGAPELRALLDGLNDGELPI